MKRWLINGRFLTQPLTGVQRYAREITGAIDQLLALDEESNDLRVALCVPEGAPHPASLKRIEVIETRGLHGPIWDQIALPRQQARRIVSFCNLGPLIADQHILCIHDLNTRLAPKSYAQSFRLAYRFVVPALARRATRLFTVSRFSADLLLEAGMAPRTGVGIAPNGHEHALNWRPERSSIGQLPRPYVFMLGSLAPHKNIGILLQSAEALDKLGIDLVVAGGADAIFAAYPLAQRDNVRMLGRISDDDLGWLFSNALCFAFPSILEGFGTPLLEAMVHGAPIVSSSAASLPEVAGDAALYADPMNGAAWLDAIERVRNNAQLREELRDRGRQRARLFSWTDSAKHYLTEMKRLTG